MPLEPTTLLLLALFGGLVAVDGTSFGQFMISRPFVAATIAGWIVGAPEQGATIGIVLEAFQLTVLPVGAARYPEGGPAAVAGGAAYGLLPAEASVLLIVVILVLFLEWLGGETVQAMRQTNVRLISENHRPPSSARALERRHLAAIGLDFLRGTFLVSGGVLLLLTAGRFLGPLWGLGETAPRTILAAIVVGLLASAVRLVGWRAGFAAAGVIGGGGLLLLV